MSAKHRRADTSEGNAGDPDYAEECDVWMRAPWPFSTHYFVNQNPAANGSDLLGCRSKAPRTLGQWLSPLPEPGSKLLDSPLFHIVTDPVCVRMAALRRLC